jgi:hypothetical protein
MVNIIIWFISCFALKQRPHHTGPAAVHHNHLDPVSHSKAAGLAEADDAFVSRWDRSTENYVRQVNPTSRFPLEKEANDDLTDPSGTARRYREVQNVLPFPISQLKSQRDRKVIRANAELGTEISYLFYWALVGWLLLNM